MRARLVFVFCLLTITKDLGENLSPNPIPTPGRFAPYKGVASPRLTPAMPARLWLALARFACVAQKSLS